MSPARTRMRGLAVTEPLSALHGLPRSRDAGAETSYARSEVLAAPDLYAAHRHRAGRDVEVALRHGDRLVEVVERVVDDAAAARQLHQLGAGVPRRDQRIEIRLRGGHGI